MTVEEALDRLLQRVNDMSWNQQTDPPATMYKDDELLCDLVAAAEQRGREAERERWRRLEDALYRIPTETRVHGDRFTAWLDERIGEHHP